MFQYPSIKSNFEHGFPQNIYYDKFRKPGIEAINKLKASYNEAYENGEITVEERDNIYTELDALN